MTKPDPKCVVFQAYRNEPEAKGKFTVEETAYGYNVLVNDKFLAHVDLFYHAEAENEPDNAVAHTAVQVHDERVTEDPLLSLHWMPLRGLELCTETPHNRMDKDHCVHIDWWPDDQSEGGDHLQLAE